ncbi:MAG: tetraacyldisaccharide 4'-kinase [Desulfobulbus sp.]|uniref:tetraacyldisaccharide 4'-kinase n=1 Tax=Desulfobulbus sp. TaxID=895 RepID=UPI00284B90C5|nr:tetraacyldisaccharide 4'-kinase [Desulfobulbus sp.]MDR2549362.1 tetraacyldisaccharide 4'-kinase [Desulfobulbus sp.]
METNSLFFTFGRPFSPLYSLAMRLRESLYRRGTLPSYRFEVPVVSVGNLTMGGTGKTPMVQYLARLLQEHGFRPAIVSRGYGGAARGKVNLVSDGSNLLLDAHAAGDEPRLLAETLPGVPVLTGIVRRLPARRALELGADVLLLDDGFQHLPIVRDIDLVLFNTDRLAGNSRVFPGGDLREPVAALRRATGFVMTGVHEANRERAERFADLLRSKFPDIPVAFAGLQLEGLVEIAPSGMIVPAEAAPFEKTPCFGFCGIAHPELFRQTLIAQGFSLAGFLALADHQRYSEAQLDRLLGQARKSGAQWLLATEKDLVKLADRAGQLPLPLYGLRMRVAADADFSRTILKQLSSRSIPR